MALQLQHSMRPQHSPDDIARGRFVSGLRSFILNDLAQDMRHAYDTRAARSFEKLEGRTPQSSAEAHKAMRPDPAFKVYSACRVHAQSMVWDSVIPVVVRNSDQMDRAVDETNAMQQVALDPNLIVPRNVEGLDVHLMPGGYAKRDISQVAAGAIYDQGLAVFSMGLMGENLDDIGLSMSAYIRAAFPDFKPRDILDVGCTIGHNTLPWKMAYPEAAVHAVDVAAPGLIYGATRAKLQKADIHFHQMNAESLGFESGSFDVVFSSMFLHELSAKTRAAFFKEANRLLRPGGLILNMELPPNSQMGAFEGFYLDWDCYYNNEPFYKGFRDQDPRALCRAGGFDDADYLQFVVPSIGIYGAEAVEEAARAPLSVDQETTGRLAEGVQWFGFGAWKVA